MSWVFERSRSKKNARLLLLAIADCANDEGRQAYPSMPKLQQKTGLSERSVTNLVAELEKLGELKVSRNAGPRGCNLYTVVMTPAESAPPQNLHPRKTRQAPPQNLRPTPAKSAPGTIREPSKEPSLKTHSADALPLTAFADSDAKRPRRPNPPDDPAKNPAFMDWYRTYPRAAARPDAYRAWSKAVAKISADELLAKTTDFAEAHRRCGTEERFIPHPTTWLNQERWNDRLPEPRAAPTGHRPYRNPEDTSIYEGSL